MIEFKELTLKDRESFESIFSIYNPVTSEYTFTNFFMWRQYYNYRFAILDGFLCVYAIPSGEEPYLMIPVGEGSEAAFKSSVLVLRETFDEMGLKQVFKKVPERELEKLLSALGSDCTIINDRDNSDYVYSRSDLVELPGRKYHGKRNHLNRFMKEYTYEYIPMTSKHINDCKEIMENWCRERNCDCHRGEYCERYANLEVLDNFDELGCRGALIKVDGEYRAFTVGEKLNSDTAVIHIEKADFKTNGLYAFINREFCAQEWSGADFINREQDLGQEGIRRAKLSYNPSFLSQKFTVYKN